LNFKELPAAFARAGPELKTGEIMKHSLLTAAPLTIAAVLGALPAGNAYGQFAPRGGHTEIPDSSIEQPQHIGVRAHTNYKMFMPAAGEMAKALPLQASPQMGPPYSG